MSLPRTLDETYERILTGIRPESQQEAIAALTWLVYSKRPMSVSELAEASVIDIASTTIQPFEIDERLFNPKSILEILSGLISLIRPKTGPKVIRLAHFSVEEYLVSERIKTSPASPFQLSFDPAVQKLAAGCLYYLLSSDVHNERRKRPLKFPLLKYAANYWPIYVKECQRPTPEWLMNVVMKFFECAKGFQISQRAWEMRSEMDASNRGCSSRWNKDSSFYLSPTYYACCLGMTEVVQRLVDKDSARNESSQGFEGQDLRALPERYADELRVACHHGHEDVVSILLEAGADHSAIGGKFRTALNAAMNTESPNERVIIRLLEVENRLQTSDFLAGWVMRWAVGHGHLRVVELMLQKVKGFDPSFKWTVLDSSWRNPNTFFESVKEQRFGPFQWARVSYINLCSSPYQAVLHGHAEIVQTLVEHWTNIDEEDYEGRTALYWAAFRGDETSARLLLLKGARPDVPVRGYEWQATDWASGTIRQLLEEKKSASRSGPTQSGGERHIVPVKQDWTTFDTTIL